VLLKREQENKKRKLKEDKNKKIITFSLKIIGHNLK
jgi:hypothetical protein